MEIVFKIVVDPLTVVELNQEAEEPREILLIVEGLNQLFSASEDVYEVVHDKGENGHSEEQNYGDHDPLDIAPGVEVSEADCCQRGESKVHHYDSSPHACVIVHVKEDDEILMVVLSVILLVTHFDVVEKVKQDVRDNAQEIRDHEQDNHQSESLEGPVDPKSGHDRGVVMSVVLC